MVWISTASPEKTASTTPSIPTDAATFFFKLFTSLCKGSNFTSKASISLFCRSQSAVISWLETWISSATINLFCNSCISRSTRWTSNSKSSDFRIVFKPAGNHPVTSFFSSNMDTCKFSFSSRRRNTSSPRNVVNQTARRSASSPLVSKDNKADFSLVTFISRPRYH